MTATVVTMAQAIDAPVNRWRLPEYLAFRLDDRSLDCAFFAERGQSQTLQDMQFVNLDHTKIRLLLRSILRGRAVVHLSAMKYRNMGFGFVVDSLDPADGGPILLPHKHDTPFQFIQQQASEQN